MKAQSLMKVTISIRIWKVKIRLEIERPDYLTTERAGIPSPLWAFACKGITFFTPNQIICFGRAKQETLKVSDTYETGNIFLHQ